MLQDISPEDFIVTEEVTPELWSQLEGLLDQVFITQDEVTLSLLRKLPNCRVAFLIRKEDNVLISALSAVFTKQFVYANFYVTRKEYRSFGYGLFLLGHFYDEIKAIDRPLIGKARDAMLEKYMKGPVQADPLSEIFNVFPKNKEELLAMFPLNNNNFNVITTDRLTPDQMDSLLKFDQKVTGADRSTFLKHFVPMVKGAVILDSNGAVAGYAATRPCRNMPDKWQIAPLWAEDEEAAGALLECLMEQVDRDVEFIVQCRKETKGNYILEMAKECQIRSALVAHLCDFGRAASAPKFQEKINKDLMFVANGCSAHPDA